MILHALKDYYDRKSSDPDSGIAPEGFEYKEIPFVIVLDKEGNLVQIECTRQQVGKQMRAKAYLVPQAEKRTRGIKANLLWDNAEYLLGLAKDNASFDALQKHKAFFTRINNLELTDDEGVVAVLNFLTHHPIIALEDNQYITEIKETNPFMSFRLVSDICLVNQRAVVIDKIRAGNSSNETYGVCLITGERGLLSKLQPAIKGVRGANSTGGNIVSFNLAAFNSYGKTQGGNAPISEQASFAYTTALNHLLGKDSKQKIQVGDASVVFWSARASQLENRFSNFFDEPPKDNPDQLTDAVTALYNSVQAGAIPDQEAKTQFFILGLSPNAARISIRFWLVGTIADFSDKILQHFTDLKISHAPYEKDYLSLWSLLRSTAIQGKTENIAPDIAGDWMRCIWTGKNFPYPEPLFQAVLRRIHAEKDITYQRAAIIKAYLNRKARFQHQPEECTVSLDRNNQNPAYRLGRLFSVLEKIQEEAHDRNINATIKDKYYSSASATPNSVFPILLRLKQHHLRKISSTNKGRSVNFEKWIGEIMDDLSCFPAQLKLEDQGHFALGYYQQRQDFFKKSDTETIEENKDGN